MAYSYNGVVLPDINTVYTPELRERYPYAVIITGDMVSRLYALYICMKLPYFNSSGGLVMGKLSLQDNVACRKYTIYHPDVGAGEDWFWDNIISFETLDDPSVAFWTNTDILNTDGSVFLKATDPIPIYEGSVTT